MNIKERTDFLFKLGRLFTKKEKLKFFIILLTILVMSVFQALGVALIFPFMSLLMDPNVVFESEKIAWVFHFFHFQDVRSFTIAAGLLTTGIIIIGNMISAAAVWMKSRFVWHKNHQLSYSLLEKYVFSPYAYFLTRNTADLGKNILAEVQMLTMHFMIPLLEILTDMAVIVLIFFVLLFVNPIAMGVICLVFFLFYGIIYAFGLRRNLKIKGHRRLQENAQCFKSVSQALGGIKDIKVLGRETYFLGDFKDHSLQFSKLHSWLEIAGQLPRYFVEILAFGGTMVFILFLIASEKNIQKVIPMISFFVFAGYRMIPIMNRMFHAFTKIQFNKAVLDKICGDLEIEQGAAAFALGDEVQQEVTFERDIHLQDIFFAYSKMDQPILDGISLSIKKNASVAIVGQTGCGKTTLVDVFLGLLSPERGAIKVDGVRITTENIRAWQKRIGYVPQFIYLSDDSIKRNIAFGLPDEMIDMQRVRQAAEIANLSEFIERGLPQAYDTVVGERGVRLSGGQRQRVGIARALYHDPDILVFDEATSALDGVTEDAVLEAIENISVLKTMIIVAHRITTVKKCDTIYLMDAGRIAASGTYDKLKKENLQFQAMAGGKEE